MKRVKTNYGSVTKLVALWLERLDRPATASGGKAHFQGNKLYHSGELVAVMTEFNGRTVVLWSNPSRSKFPRSHDTQRAIEANYPLLEMGNHFALFHETKFDPAVIHEKIMADLLEDQSQKIDRIFEELDELHTWDGQSEASPHHWNLREFNKLVSRVGLPDLRIDAPKEYLEFAHQYISLCAFATEQIKARHQLQLWKEGKRRRSRR